LSPDIALFYGVYTLAAAIVAAAAAGSESPAQKSPLAKGILKTDVFDGSVQRVCPKPNRAARNK